MLDNEIENASKATAKEMQSDIEKTDNLEKLNSFRMIARQHFEYFFPPTQKSEAWSEERTKIRRDLEGALETLPQGIADQICEEEKQRALNVPDSMFLSDQAFNRFMESTSEVQMVHIGNLKELRDNDPGALAEYFGEFNFRNVDNSPLELAQFIIASKEIDGKNHEVGGTAYRIETDRNGKKAAYVIFQRAFNFPGLGLGMLKNLIGRAKNDDFSAIDLTTLKFPRGLGNLGFKYTPMPWDYYKAYYHKEIVAEETESNA